MGRRSSAAATVAIAAIFCAMTASGQPARDRAYEEARQLQGAAQQRPLKDTEVDRLADLASNPDWRVQVRALTALRLAATPEQKEEALRVMREMLKDDESVVRASAAQGLANVGDTGEIAFLEPLKADPDPRVRYAASRGIGDLYRAAGETEKAIATYEEATGIPELDPNSRALLARELTELHTEEAAKWRRKAAGWGRQADPGARLVGKPAPDFAFKNEAGKEIRLSELRGKVVLLNFWSAWSEPCREEAPHLEKLYRKYRRQGLVVLGLNNAKEPQGAIQFAKETFTYPVVLGAGPVFQRYHVKSIPTTYIINRKGAIVARKIGFDAGQQKGLEEAVKTLLAITIVSRSSADGA